jgi:type I restriction enzyme, S subunit
MTGDKLDNPMMRSETMPLTPSWEVKSFPDVIAFESGQFDPRIAPYSKMLHVGPDNIAEGSGRLLECKTAEELKLISGKYLFSDRHVLYSKIRPYLRKAALPTFEGICSADMYPLRPKDGSLIREFLYYWLLSAPFTTQAVSFQDRTGIPKINRQQLESTWVLVPPLREQQAIAHVLRTVQRAKEATERVIAATRQLKASLTRHLFTYGPVPVNKADRLTPKETEFGPMPSHWEPRCLGDFIAIGPQNGLYKPESSYGSGTPIVRINDYDNEGGVLRSVPNRVRLSEAEVKNYFLNTGDILINRVNSLSHLGKPALVEKLTEPTVYESNMMRFKVATALATPEYVFRALGTPNCRDQLRGAAKRAVAQSSVNQGDVKSVVLPLPPDSEQRDIVAILDAVEEKIRVEKARGCALSVVFTSLLHYLMTGKIRVHDLEFESGGADSGG